MILAFPNIYIPTFSDIMAFALQKNGGHLLRDTTGHLSKECCCEIPAGAGCGCAVSGTASGNATVSTTCSGGCGTSAPGTYAFSNFTGGATCEWVYELNVGGSGPNQLRVQYFPGPTYGCTGFKSSLFVGGTCNANIYTHKCVSGVVCTNGKLTGSFSVTATTGPCSGGTVSVTLS